MFQVAFIAHDQPPTMIHPRKAAFHFAAVTIVRACTDRAPTCGMTPWSADQQGERGLDAPPTPIPPEGLASVGFISAQFLRSRAWTPLSPGHSYGGQGRFGQRALVRLRTCDLQPDRHAVAISHHHDVRALAKLCPPAAGPLVSLGRHCRPERLVPTPVCCAHPVRATVAAKCRPRYHPPSRPGSAASRWSAIRMCEAHPPKYNLFAAQTEFHSGVAGHPLACVQAPATAAESVAGSPPIARRSVHVGSCPQFSVSPRNFEMACSNTIVVLKGPPCPAYSRCPLEEAHLAFGYAIVRRGTVMVEGSGLGGCRWALDLEKPRLHRCRRSRAGRQLWALLQK